MKNKKGIGNEIIWVILGVFILVLLLHFVNKSIAKTGEETYDLLSSTEDIDGDDVPNALDKCLCLEGSIENDGCPSNIRTEEDIRKNKCTGCEKYKIKNCK